MKKQEYMEILRRAVEDFERDQIIEDLEDNNATTEEWNDEFMLELYSLTEDLRRI